MFSQIDAFPRQKPSPFGWKWWLVLVLGAIGVSALLAGYLWLGTGAFVGPPFAHGQWSLWVFVAITIVFSVCTVWWLYPVLRLISWLALIPGAVGMSFLLVGLIWLGIRALLRQPFPHSRRSLLVLLTPTTILSACAIWYWYPVSKWNVWVVPVSVAVGVSIALVVSFWISVDVFLRWPFPRSRRSLLIFVAVASTLLGCAAWYSYPVPRAPSARGVFLRDILRPTRKHKEWSTALKERTLDMCSTREGLAQAEAVYAMALSGVATQAELEARLTSRESADMLALGRYFAGNYESAWWQWGAARLHWDKAMSVARTKRLKIAISKRIKASERWHRHL